MLDIKSVWGVMTHGLCWKWWENEYSILEIVLEYLAWNESFCLNNGIETSTLEEFGERMLSLKWQRRNYCSSVNGWHWSEIINLYLFNVLQLLMLLNEIIVKLGQSGEWWMKFFFVGNYFFFFFFENLLRVNIDTTWLQLMLEKTTWFWLSCRGRSYIIRQKEIPRTEIMGRRGTENVRLKIILGLECGEQWG